jgi:hypothetical protein
VEATNDDTLLQEIFSITLLNICHFLLNLIGLPKDEVEQILSQLFSKSHLFPPFSKKATTTN